MLKENHLYWAGSYPEAAIGISPNPTEIKQRTVLYRFIDLGKGAADWCADGPWWFEERPFHALTGFSVLRDVPLGYCARLFAATAHEYGRVNALVRAEVIRGPLQVWKGLATPTVPRGEKLPEVEWPADSPRRHDPPIEAAPDEAVEVPDLIQVFIPGLGHPHHKFRSFMRLTGATRIATG